MTVSVRFAAEAFWIIKFAFEATWDVECYRRLVLFLMARTNLLSDMNGFTAALQESVPFANSLCGEIFYDRKVEMLCSLLSIKKKDLFQDRGFSKSFFLHRTVLLHMYAIPGSVFRAYLIEEHDLNKNNDTKICSIYLKVLRRCMGVEWKLKLFAGFTSRFTKTIECISLFILHFMLCKDDRIQSWRPSFWHPSSILQ